MSGCVLCGRPFGSAKIITETISDRKYFFDKKTCAVTFKKLHAVYGSEFVADFVS